jgi:hypothetical protein
MEQRTALRKARIRLSRRPWTRITKTWVRLRITENRLISDAELLGGSNKMGAREEVAQIQLDLPQNQLDCSTLPRASVRRARLLRRKVSDPSTAR